MQKLRGDKSAEAVMEEWQEGTRKGAEGSIVDVQGDRSIDPMEQKYRCMQCCLELRACMKPPADFGVEKPSDLGWKLLMQGMWAR